IEDLTVSGLHGGVALAGAAFKRVALEHCYAAVCVADNAVLLQLGSSRADPFPTHPQHVRDERVRHNELTRSEAVEAGEQPAAKLLLDGMMTVTPAPSARFGASRLQQSGAGAARVRGPRPVRAAAHQRRGEKRAKRFALPRATPRPCRR